MEGAVTTVLLRQDWTNLGEAASTRLEWTSIMPGNLAGLLLTPCPGRERPYRLEAPCGNAQRLLLSTCNCYVAPTRVIDTLRVHTEWIADQTTIEYTA
jgi:hypothetical protein